MPKEEGLDDEYIEQLKAMGQPEPSAITVVNPDKARIQALEEEQQRLLEVQKKEQRMIRRWQKSFRQGNLDALKDDVGTVAGSLAVQIVRLLEEVAKDGPVVETTKFINGQPYTEKVTHPALISASKIAKDLGIDLSSFLMTPKAIKENGPQVQVNIGLSADDVQARFAARFKPKVIDIEVGHDDHAPDST